VRRSLVIIVALTVLAGACGGKKADNTGKASRALVSDKAESGLAEAGKPQRGGKLIYGIEAETAGGFCLSEGQLAISGMMVVRAIYDTLMVPNSKGEEVPYLAKSLTHNANYTVFDLTVRDGVKFHDGSTLDGRVVKNNIDAYRGKYPGRVSLLAGFSLSNIASVDLTGPMTVRITTKLPWIAFPGYLGGSRFGIMAQAQLDDKETCNTKLIGTGPFKFQSWQPNQKLVAVLNPDYWQIARDGKPYPYADSIEFRPIVEGAQRINAIQSGSVNVTHTSSAPDIGDTLTKLRDDGKVNMYQTQVATELGYLMINASKPPFNDERMRRAFAMAVDRNEINNVLGEGYPTVADGPFAPGNMAYLKDPGFPKHNVAEAKRLVQEYERGGGKAEFTLTLVTDPAVIQVGEMVQQQIAKAGFHIKLVNEEQAKLISDAIGGNFQVMTFRNHPGDDPDGQYVWWYKGTSNPVNFGRINDPVIDKLLDEGRSELDPAKRQRIYQDLNREFAAKVWNIWLSYTPWAVVESPNVHGILGPDLPDGGGKPFQGLANGHPVLGMWIAR